MERMMILLSLSIVVAILSSYFDKNVTKNSILRNYANSEILFSLILSFVAIPCYLTADTPRAFLPGSEYFWGFLSIVSIAWFFFGMLLLWGYTYPAKMFLFTSFLRMLIPVFGWIFSYISLRYYFKAKINGYFSNSFPNRIME